MHWAGLLYRQMRWAGEDGCEETSIFDRNLLQQMRQDEPDIDALMPSILTYLARMWREEPLAFVGRINAQLGTAYAVDEVIAKSQFVLSR